MRSVKVSLVEQMRRSLRARLKGIAHLVCMERHDECTKYHKVLVFVCRFGVKVVTILPL